MATGLHKKNSWNDLHDGQLQLLLPYKLAFEINSIPGWENGIPFSYLDDEFMNNPILLDLAVQFSHDITLCH